jgi:hypothetical protein
VAGEDMRILPLLSTGALEAPADGLQGAGQPENAAMTWLEVLWALGALEHGARVWSLGGIEASRPVRAEPRNRLPEDKPILGVAHIGTGAVQSV